MNDPTRRRATTLPVTPAEWVEDAACATVDPALFFPTADKDNHRDAKRICAGCPARVPCLEDALARNELHGVWGGLTYNERRSLRRRAIRDRKAAA